MTTLKQLSPKLLSVIEEVQEVIKDYKHSNTFSRYGIIENVNNIVNDPDLLAAIAEVKESNK